MAFLVTLTETSYSSGGEWVMEINGGIWPIVTALTASVEIITELNHRRILLQEKGG